MSKIVFDLVTVGHFAIDLILSPEIVSPRSTLGGSPAYVSSAARELGANVAVISKVGQDFPEEYLAWLKKHNIELISLEQTKNNETTRFDLDYTKGERRLQLKSLAPLILSRQIPVSMRAKAVHVAPIANEVSMSVVNKLRGSTETLSFDPQGFVRRFNDKGEVYLKNLENPEILEQVDVYKSTLSEIRKVTGLHDLVSCLREIHDYGAKVVIVTEGVKGSTMFFEGKFYRISACTPKIIRDLTGAGDTFIGAFLAEYVKNKNPVWCACVGSAAASFAVQSVGPTLLGNKRETYKKAHEVYKKGVKLLARM